MRGLHRILDSLLFITPFILTINNGSGKKLIKFNFQRIIEALIIAIIAGIFSAYITVREIKLKVEFIEKEITTVNKRVDKLDERLYQHQRVTEPQYQKIQ